MRTLTLLFLLCCLSANNLSAQSECNLPAPGLISIVEQTQTTVEVQWSPVNGAWGYLAVLDDGTTKVEEVLVGVLNTDVKFNILPGVDYDIKVYPKCSEETVSPYLAHIRIDGVHIIVIDLIVSVQPTGPDPNLLSLLFTQATFTPGAEITTGVPIQTGPTYYYKFFYGQNILPVQGYLQINSNTGDNKHITLEEINNSKSLNWYIWGFGSTAAAPPAPTLIETPHEYAVLGPTTPSNNTLKIRGQGPGDLTPPTLYLTSQTADIKNFQLFKVLELGLKESEEHAGQLSPQGSTPTTGPNPFHNNINILLSGTPAAPVSVNIFDINGRLLQTNVLSADHADQRAFSIETTDLPAGVHIVRVDTGAGNIQTFKMVKM